MKDDPAASGQRLRVAVLSRHFDPSAGGAERYAVSMVEQLAGRHEIHVYAQSFGPAVPGVQQHRVPAGPRTRWLNQLWFAVCTAWQCRDRYDVVHSHEATWYGQVQTIHVRPVRVNLFAGRVGWKRWLRWLGTVTSPRLLAYLLVEAARMRVSPRRAIVAVSDPLKQEMVQAYPRLQDAPIDIVPPGVTPLVPGALGERAATRDGLGLPADAFVLLLVANDHRKKGVPAAMQALAGLGSDVHLLVVGGAREVLAGRQRAQQLGLADRVHFVGKVADPGPMYRAADLLVHPALEDTFGMVVPEAMSQGLPVIVSEGRWCGVAAGLRPGLEAWLLRDPRDATELANAIVSLQRDPQARERLASAGRVFAAHLDWQVLALQQEAIYRRVACARP